MVGTMHGHGQNSIPDNGIAKLACAGYAVYVKNDGYDYLALFDKYLAGTLELERFGLRNREHEVSSFEVDGRKFVLKKDRERPKHFENKLWSLLYGPFYSKQMKAVNRAVRCGCTALPDIFLVAEKQGGLLCAESIMLMEFVSGGNITRHGPLVSNREKMLGALADIHKYGLALGDCNLGNFLISDEGECKLIDLSWRGSPRFGKASDIVTMKRDHGWDMPVSGLLDKLAVIYMYYKKKLRGIRNDAKRKSGRGKR